MKEEKQKEANHVFHFISFSLYLLKNEFGSLECKHVDIKLSSPANSSTSTLGLSLFFLS